MDLFGLVPFLGRSKEKDTVDLMLDQMGLVYDSVSCMKSSVEALAKGDSSLFAKKRDEVNRIEDDADSLARKIEENLYSGAFLAASRSRILDLVEDIDDIVDSCKDVVGIGEMLVGVKLDGEMSVLVERHLTATLECVKYLKKCVEAMNHPEGMHDFILQVRAKEHEVDTISGDLLRLLMRSSYDGKDFVMISKMFEVMDRVSDRAEDASDTLNLIILMHKP